MYPFLRLAGEALRSRGAPPLSLTDTHLSWHCCWPWDLDPWLELNNGRTLTLFDLGRMGLAQRTGLVAVLRREAWALTVAGVSVRFRRRVRVFQRLAMRTRCIGWDDRFVYLEQSFWQGSECSAHILLRVAITDRDGIVDTARVADALGLPGDGPELPDWVRAWIAAEALRPWPPMQDDPAGPARGAAA